MAKRINVLLKHAKYYRQKIEELNTLFLNGRGEIENARISFNLDLSQIYQAYTYVKGDYHNTDTLSLCISYAVSGGSLLHFYQDKEDYIQWQKTGLRGECQELCVSGIPAYNF